jgi:hypothetical protein
MNGLIHKGKDIGAGQALLDVTSPPSVTHRKCFSHIFCELTETSRESSAKTFGRLAASARLTDDKLSRQHDQRFRLAGANQTYQLVDRFLAHLLNRSANGGKCW